MPPTDSTPTFSAGSFELVHSLKAYDTIPVYEYRSKNTGLTVVIAEVDGPVINGFFCLATEALDDDGLPHTLEHLIFLGSEDYPYKGVLDLLANRCFASGTNAWTDTDHTCYTMETVGSEGFLALMPIFLDHILYPLLTDEAFKTEVHHVSGDGHDAGIVYSEMQAKENTGEAKVFFAAQKALYPGYCGYGSETGGRLKNLRESTNNWKVRDFHKKFYRPENLKLIISGIIKHDELFTALAPMEQKILSKGDRGPFERPWQSPVPPLEQSEDLIVHYAADEETNGMVVLAWRGPSAVTDLYGMAACNLMLKYLTESSVSLLQQCFVEMDDPYCSEVSYNIVENSISTLYLVFKNVPIKKLGELRTRVDDVLRDLIFNAGMDMRRMKSIIKRHKYETMSMLENTPHSTIAFLIIGQMLYGNTKEDYEERLNPIVDFDKLDQEHPTFWLRLVRTFFIDAPCVSVQGVPSIVEKTRLEAEERARRMRQANMLGYEGLKRKGEELAEAIEFNERKPPNDMLTCVPIPSLKNINYHEIKRYTSETESTINMSGSPVYVFYDNVKSSFVYMYGWMDTSQLNPEQRLYIPLLLETMLESPVMRDGKLVSYKDVVTELQDDTVQTVFQIGLCTTRRFNCSSFAHSVAIVLQVAACNYEKGVGWLSELMYQTVFTAERLKIIATKILNALAEAKRSGRDVVSYIMRALYYIEDSNQMANTILKQQMFLTNLIRKLDYENYQTTEILENFDKIRKIITRPQNVALYMAANFESLTTPPGEALKDFIPEDIPKIPKTDIRRFNIVPDWKLMAPDAEGGLKRVIIGMGSIESCYFSQSTPCINVYDDPDMAALLVYQQYLTQAEGPLWREVRGKGFAYNYSIIMKINEGLMYLLFGKAANVVDAYKEVERIMANQVTGKKWDKNLLESAKSSLVYELIQHEITVGDVINHSVEAYFYNVEFEYNRQLVDIIKNITVEDLNRVGDKYIANLFDPTKVRTGIVCNTGMVDNIAQRFRGLNMDVQAFHSLEGSFLSP